MTDVDRGTPELAATTRLVTPAQRVAIAAPGTLTPPWKPTAMSTTGWSSSHKEGRSSMGTSLPPTPSTHMTHKTLAPPIQRIGTSTASTHSIGGGAGVVMSSTTAATHRFGAKPPRSGAVGGGSNELRRYHSSSQGHSTASQHSQPLPPDARIRSVTSRAGQDQVLAEYIVEHEIKVPKRTTREDLIERTYVVPERVLVEEIVEEAAKVVERVVEVAQPVVMEKIVEIPEYEYIEKIVEVPHKVLQEKIREVSRVEVQERLIEIPRLVPREKIVNFPVYEYHEIPVEKIVEVPEIRQQVVLKEKIVPRYVDKPVPQERTIEIENTIERRTPVPVEAVTYLQLQLPKIRPVYQQLEVPVYVPRFIEVSTLR